MAQFTYSGDDGRVYPDISVDGSVLVAESGKTYDLDTAPDELWVSVSQTPSKAPTGVSINEVEQTPSESA
jgi:hypothetical protein